MVWWWGSKASAKWCMILGFSRASTLRCMGEANYEANYVSTVIANGSSIMDAVHFLAAETCRAALAPSRNKAYTTRSSNALKL